MILIQVDYPFEVDEGRGLSDRCYPTLDGAIGDARDLFRVQHEQEESWPDGAERPTNRPAFVKRVEVRKLDRAAVCEILNTEGGGWRAGDELIGRIVFTPWSGVTFEKGGA